jgi:hypothetical protein
VRVGAFKMDGGFVNGGSAGTGIFVGDTLGKAEGKSVGSAMVRIQNGPIVVPQ